MFPQLVQRHKVFLTSSHLSPLIQVNLVGDTAEYLLRQLVAENSFERLFLFESTDSVECFTPDVNLSSGQTIKIARAVRLEVALASYILLENLLLKTGVRTFLGTGPTVAGRSHYPCQCGSTVVESLASH